MRFITILVSCLFILSCASNSEIQHQTIIPIVASTVTKSKIEEQKIVSKDIECQNVKNIIGSADISFDGRTIITFYEKPAVSQTPAQTLRFYEDKELKMDSFKAEGEKSYNLLNPDMHKLDYYIFNLAVKSRRNGWLEVVVDDKTKENLWLQENKDVEFKDWFEKMKTSFATGRLNKQSNPLLTKSDGTGEKIIFEEDESFDVVEMKGDWIKVNSKNLSNEKKKKSVSGWIHWRDENGCLLVEIFPFA